MTVKWLVCGLSDVPAHDDWLSAVERDTVAGLTFDKRRRDWRLGRWTAKQLLVAGELADENVDRISVVAAADGAPEPFVGGARLPVSISLSHRDGLGLCAATVEPTAIGCDLEAIEARSRRFVDDFFTAREAQLVHGAPVERRPVLCAAVWAAKEAVLKLRRTGLRRDTRSVEVDLNADSAVPDGSAWTRFAVDDRAAAERVHGWWRKLDGHVLAIAADPPQSAVVELRPRW